jgi:signal transduction histidine kinase
MGSVDGATAPDRTGIPREVLFAAAATTVGAVPLVPALAGDVVPTGALFLLGWPVLGVVAAVLLDRRPGSRLGRVLALLALVPALVVGAAAVGRPFPSVWDRLESLPPRGDVVLVLLAVTPVAWAVGFAPDRLSRRRLAWVTAWSAILAGVVAAAAVTAPPRTLGLVTTLGLCGLAGVLLRLETATELRPVDEPLIDAGTVLVAAAVGAGTGSAVRILLSRAGLPLPEASAVFAAVLTAALAWPLALRLRRLVLERRYGTGVLPPQAVAAITEDLRPDADPRELLGRAAAMIAAASGHPEVRLVLGTDDPGLPAGWTSHALVVGTERVGTLLVRTRHPEGPEPRQERVVAQLLPTVALMTRAVGLAVEAEQARLDVARERDAERARILGDLHDELGPVLAGMSMRVQAELRHRSTPLLEAVATGLADARDDLRRVVSDLTPSALRGSGLAEALERLVGTFAVEGSCVVLEADLGGEPSPETAVAVYRSVAEGATNALRHGGAHHVTVSVRSLPEGIVVVDVRDDGAGGEVVPGVGLTSLRRRAEELGGTLVVGHGDPRGVRLHVELPDGVSAR